MDSRADLDIAYSNGAFIAGAADYPPKWARAAADFRAGLGARAQVGLTYGPASRQVLDLFLPAQPSRGLLVFIHGGYWMDFDRSIWSHLAQGAVQRGWAVAMPSYTLAPQARIADMTREISAAIAYASARAGGPIVVTGHSAGGHLAARMACADLAQTVPITRAVPISPLADLAPIARTSMNDTLHLDAAEIAAESPARHALRAGTSAHVWVGAQERPAFLYQARLLSEAWSCPWTAHAGCHHFDVIDDLADPNSPLIDTCLNGIG